MGATLVRVDPSARGHPAACSDCRTVTGRSRSRTASGTGRTGQSATQSTLTRLVLGSLVRSSSSGAACRAGDTLVVTKLDRLARSLPDAWAILEDLTRRQVKLSLGGAVHDPTDPVGRLLLNVLAIVAGWSHQAGGRQVAA